MPIENDGTVEIVVGWPPSDEGEVMSQVATAGAVNLGDLFRGEQARCLQQMAGNFEHTGHVLRAVENKKFDEVDLGQSIAMKEAGKTGAHTDPRLPVAPI